MPKVKSFAVPWLAANAPGHQLFEPSADARRSHSLAPSYSSSKKQALPGPRRTIARRGTEVFVAVGREIRWGDLAYLKEEWLSKQPKNRAGGFPHIKREDSFSSFGGAEEELSVAGLRTIKTPVADDIRQLIISPNANFLAIITTHTVHICVLPDPSHLTSEDDAPLKPKIYSLGPTTHVTSRSPISSVLWHPLGVSGTCVVTVTTDAVVRLWELSLSDRWSFDAPTSSIDLKKLADGTTLDQDFSFTSTMTNKAFSPDSYEMEVAAASFAKKGSGGWNPMTLWIAMREGDVYALCPLLPQRWAPPPTLIPSLSVSIVTTLASIEDDPTVAEHEKLLAQQQMQWMGELDSQEPHVIEGPLGESLTEVYTRPSRPGITPRLQGPFDLMSDPETGDELDTSITDIMVIGKKTETDELMMGEEDELEMDEAGDQEGLSLAVLCLLSSSGQVRIYLDLDGVQAQWLPPKNKPKALRYTNPDPPSLLAFQAMDTMSPVEINEDGWPVFSEDVMSRYSFYVTHHASITYISLTPWIFRLESELNGDSEAGTDFRVGLVINSQSARDKIYSQSTADVSVPLAACNVMRDPDVGYFLLSSTPYEPIAITFDTPDDDLTPLRAESPSYERETPLPPVEVYEPRPVFQVPHAFDEGSSLPALLAKLRSSRHKTVVNQDVKLSPLTLQIFTDAHKILSDETYRLGVAAAAVFRRCEMLQSELKRQVTKANEVNNRIEPIIGAHRDGETDNDMFERRISEAKTRQKNLVERLENLRKAVGNTSTRDLSAKERAYMEEVRTVEASISATSEDDEQKNLWKRLEDVKRLQAELAGEVESLVKAGDDNGDLPSTPDLVIPAGIRKTKLQQVQSLLSRETALVEAVRARLERLQTGL
jgi:nucleoporin NUP82